MDKENKIVELLNKAMRSWAGLFGHYIGDFEWKYYAKNCWQLTIDNLWYTDEQYSFFRYSDRDICGKDGGFIRWLVDNDKIDENKVFNDCWLYDSVLMKLAIQDCPIEYLVNILKDEPEFKVYPCRYYDDGHKDWNILGKFKKLKTIYEDSYNWEWIVEREDWMIWILKESEVSWMYDPKNWWSSLEFNEIWTKEEILSWLK